MATFVFSASSVPDWGRRAIRLALALFFFSRLGHTLWLMPEYLREEWGDELRQSANWAGASCAVVAASPLIGKVAQLSYERTLGTIAGGFLGFLAYDYGAGNLPDELDAWFLSFASAFVGALSCWLSYKYKLDASMRLFVITFLMVTFGAQNPERGALMVALLRTTGIVAGVLTLMMLTVVILPKSATVESLREVKRSLKSLVELNRLVLESIQLRLEQGQAAEPPQPTDKATEQAATAAVAKKAAAANDGEEAGSRLGWPWKHQDSKRRSDGYEPLVADEGMEEAMEKGQPHQQLQDQDRQRQQAPRNGDTGSSGGVFDAAKWDKYEAACEKVLTDVYQSMFKVKEQIELSRNEIYVWHFYGHYVFIPTLPGGLLGRCFAQQRWSLLASDMDSVATCIRRLARLLWTVHLDCDEAFDNEMMRQLNASCQGGLVQALSTALASALSALVESFPNQRTISVDGLHAFKDAVDALFALSEAQRQEVVALMARAKTKAHRPQRILQASFTQPAASQVSFVSSSWGREQQLPQLQRLFSRSLATAAATGNPVFEQVLGPVPRSSAPATAMSAPPAALQVPAGSVPGRSVLGFRVQEQNPRNSMAAAAEAAIAAVEAEGLGSSTAGSSSSAAAEQLPSSGDAATSASGAAATTVQEGGQPKEQERGARNAADSTDGSSNNTGSSNAQGSNTQGSDTTKKSSSNTNSSTTDDSTRQQLSRLQLSGPSVPSPSTPAPVSTAPSAPAAGSVDSPLAAAVANPLLFPASTHDYVSQVRWHTFQFLMDELEEELEELFLATSAVLDKLPYAV